MATTSPGNISYPTNADPQKTIEQRIQETAQSVQNALDYYPISPNYIINGAFDINQRGVTSVSLTGGGVWTVDRWFGQSFGTIGVTQSSSTTVPSNNVFTNSVKFACTSTYVGTGYAVNYTTRLEGYDVTKLGIARGQTVTLSFWVRSTRTGTYGVTINSGYRGSAYNFSYYIGTYTVSSANTWERKTITIPGNISAYTPWYTDNQNGLELTFNITGGSGIATATTTNVWVEANTVGYFYGANSTQSSWGSSTSDEFYITGVQLERGSTATPFRRNSSSIQGELAACQRYYLYAVSPQGAIADNDYSTNSTGTSFPVTMRVSPSISVISSTMAGHHSILPVARDSYPDGCGFYWTGSGYRDIGAWTIVAFTASAEL